MDQTFIPVNIALLTISDTRTVEDDTSGKVLRERVNEAEHHVVAQEIVPDDKYQIRAIVSQWIADKNVQAIISTGGTGLTGRDGTPEAMAPNIIARGPFKSASKRVDSLSPDVPTSQTPNCCNSRKTRAKLVT